MRLPPARATEIRIIRKATIRGPHRRLPCPIPSQHEMSIPDVNLPQFTGHVYGDWKRDSCFVFFFVSEYRVMFHLEFDTGRVRRVKTKRLKF
ncbi:hypothetical protein AAC387_Pa01g4404 [Persea americana]